jgi:drug/metabolite transporter (DMT)-like permease
LQKAVNTIGRALGALCGAALAVIWAFTFWVPAAGLTLPGTSAIGALMFAVFGLFATIASVRGHATVVVLLFLASFFPVGASVIRIDHWLRVVGWLDVGLLVASVLLWLTRPRGQPVPEPAD